MTRLPSRTYDIARLGLGLLAIPTLALVGMMVAGRGELTAILEALGTAMLAIAGVAGASTGAMGLSNYGSRGLTSSQGPAILAAKVAAAEKAGEGER